MKLLTKISIMWIATLAIYFLGVNIYPSASSPISGHINQFIQLLLFIISIFIAYKEPNRKNRFIFLNFAIYFSLCFISFGYDFMGKAFFVAKYSRHLYFQYMTIAYIFFNSVAIVYLVIDLLFKDFKVYQKYLSTFVIVLGFFTAYFYSFISNPLYLYSTEEIKQWKSLDAFISTNKNITSSVELSNRVTLQSWHEGIAVGDLYPDENLKQIEKLSPYLDKDNWMVLLWAPLFRKVINIDVLLIAFILLFFGYQYKKDPPQGAYIDKIMFLILLLSSMDILHNWGFIKSVEWRSLTELFTIGQYITVLAELMMVIFFALRLRFITSIQGEFYEAELAANPRQISRWRDWVDNFVLAQFFNYKIFNGRLFQKQIGK
jgi:hypothetical protein